MAAEEDLLIKPIGSLQLREREYFIFYALFITSKLQNVKYIVWRL